MSSDAALQAWFDSEGWKLDSDQLRDQLFEREVDRDTLMRLLGEAADRRRRQARTRPPARSAAAPEAAVPPQNLEAEESVIGAMMLAPGAIARVAEILDPADFYRGSHAKIYRAAVEMHALGEPVDVITLTNELERRGELDQVGGRVRLHELARLVPPAANAGHYAEIVRENAILRGLIRFGGEAAQLGWERAGEVPQLVERVRGMLDELEQRAAPTSDEQHLTGAGQFIFDTPDLDQAVWGNGTQVGWASGEGLMLVGPQGVGKTTLAQQLALARAGLLSKVLGLPVESDGRPVLYVAADRPRQAARSLRRMVAPHNREDLDRQLKIWRGPLPFLLNEQPTALARLCDRHGCGTVVLDSLKDVAVKISEDEPAAKFNIAVQHCLANGIEVLVLHHQRKQQAGAGKPKTLADVYGNTWLTAGMGSVVILWGDPGDPIVELTHLKQPIDELGPWNVRHDHDRGMSFLEDAVSVAELLRRAGDHGMTARTAAQLLHHTDEPTAAQIEKARRQLARMVNQGSAREEPGFGPREPSRYYPVGSA